MADTIKCPTCGRSTPNASFCQYCSKPLYSCKACHAAILKDAVFCPECGVLVSGEKRELLSQEHVSWAWWLLPIFAVPSFNFIGGLIAWAFNRYRDPRKATYMLWLGISLTLVFLVIDAVLRFTGGGVSLP